MNLTYGSHCKLCRKTLLLGNRIEKHVYYVGDDEVKFTAYVPTGSCPQCCREYEGDLAKLARKEAMQAALDKYWLKKLEDLAESHEVNKIKSLLRRLIVKCGDRKRRMSEELGLWLTGQHFPP